MTVTAFQQANQLLREGKLEEAVVAYQRAISQNPNFYLAYQNLGETLEKLGRWEEAVEAYQRTVELKPEAAWCLSALSQALQQVGRLEEDKKAGEQALAIDPWLAESSLKGEDRHTVTINPVQPPLSLNLSAINLTDTDKNLRLVQSKSTETQYKIILFMPYYKAKHPERQEELIYCLRKNIECPEIEKIVLLIDDHHQPELENPKIEIFNLSSRPTYLDWVELTEKKCPEQISILANTDIYFDQSVSRLREIFSANPNAFVTISRYEQEGTQQTLHKKPHWSQDVWAVYGQYKFTNSLKNTLKIPLGVPRCDNKIAYLFAIQGAKVYNPCHYIKTVHVQETDSRTYDKKKDTSILGGVTYVHPSPQLLKCSKLDFQLWAVDFSEIREVELNKSLENWAKETQPSLKHSSISSLSPPETYHPKIGCLLFPVIKKEIEDLISYFNNILLPTQQPNSLTFVISIDQTWDDKDVKRIQESLTKSKAQSCIKQVKFIACNLTDVESIYIREIPKNLSKMVLPDYGLKTGPNLQLFRSMQQLLDSEDQYTAVLLQEVDTVPLKDFWIDLINKDIQELTDALLIGPTYSGLSQLKPEQVNHLNGNGVYCLGNPLFKRFLQLWEQLVIEVCKKVPWKAYDSATEWAIKYLEDDSCWVVDKKKRKDSPYFESNELKDYLSLYQKNTHKLNQVVNKAGAVELMPETVFDPATIAEDLKSASVLHLRPALPFRDVCRYIANEQKLIESNVIGYDGLWQYPAITEKHAYDMAKKYLQNYDQSVVYLGFPWATLIDQFLHKPENTKHLLWVLEKYKPYLKQFRKVITVCQHVHLLEYQYLFDEVGVSDLFWSHAIKYQPTLPEFQEISIHPFPLFPVQATQVSPQQLRGVFRKFLFCFVGAKSPSYYLSDSRNQVIKHLSSDKRGVIRSRDTWHYKKIVYECQIKQNILDDKDLIDQSPTSEFKEILKQSVFSLCPSGSGPNSIRLWESIGYGSIPVVLSDTYLPPGDLDLWEAGVVVSPEKSDEIKALPDRLLRLNQDKQLLRQKQSALQVLWDRYGVDCFIYDIIQFFKSL